MSLAEEIKVATLEYTNLNRENQKIRSAMKKLQDKIAKLKKKQQDNMPSVTDHAILRLAERKYGLNVEKLKEELLCDVVRSAMKAGATRVKHDGMEFVLKDGLVLTVIA